MSNWYIYNKIDNYNKIKDFEGLSNIQKLILANRDITDFNAIDKVLDSSLEKMYDPFLLKGMSEAVDLLFDHMSSGANIKVVGDYDADGVSATTILIKGMGNYYDQISYIIPDRIEDGYGLNKVIVDECVLENVSLIVTCDNGIAAFEAIEYAESKGINVIVTDHHQVVKEAGVEMIPKASAVINPAQALCTYPFKNICGATVAYKFIWAFQIRYGRDLGVLDEYVYELIQFAAIGTISDVMDLVDENRSIVVEGLKRLNNTSNQGLIELLRQLNWEKEITVYAIGFIIGPTINSTGRLFSAKLAVELFLEEEISILREYAAELISLNNDRKKITKESVDKALAIVKQDIYKEKDIILLYMKETHESICGLVAGKIKEHLNKPVLVFTDSYKADKHFFKGSGRSIEAYDMHKNLSKFNDLFVAFGGHKMACGLTIKAEDFQKLDLALNGASKLSDDDFKKSINIDVALDLRNISFDFYNQIDYLAPFGKGFEKPKFASRDVSIINIALLGREKNVMKLTLGQGNKTVEAISFNPDKFIKYFSNKFKLKDLSNNLDKLLNKSIDIVYNIEINTFRDKSNIQLIIEEMR